MTVLIEPLTRADAARCAELEVQLFEGDDPWPASAFVSELSGRHNHYVAARAANQLVGYAGNARVYLEVRTDNAPAIALYRSAGFVEVGLRKRYYRVSGADAYTMRRQQK